MGIDERLQIPDGHPEFAANPDCPQLTLMNQSTDGRFANPQEFSDFMCRHEWFAQHGSIHLDTQ